MITDKWKKRDEGHWYASAADFALEHLGHGAGTCLVIGSPQFELQMLESSGWDCTYLDIRQPPFRTLKFVQHDASKPLPFPDGSFNAVSSTCVLCHVGTGRYGDAKVEDADQLLLNEIYRVLAPAGRLCAMFGPVTSKTYEIPDHRLYHVQDAVDMVEKAGMKVVYEQVFKTKADDYLSISAVRECGS